MTGNALFKSGTERLKMAVRDVPDFPKPGILFKDITPIVQNGQLLRLATTIFADRYQRRTVDALVAIEARGFLFASAVAYCLGCGVIIARKPGKLPAKTVSKSYDLEYGSNTIEIHADSLHKGQKVVVIDDVLATGGTMKATCDLVQEMGADVIETAFLIELGFLKGREKLGDLPVFSVLQYD